MHTVSVLTRRPANAIIELCFFADTDSFAPYAFGWGGDALLGDFLQGAKGRSHRCKYACETLPRVLLHFTFALYLSETWGSGGC